MVWTLVLVPLGFIVLLMPVNGAMDGLSAAEGGFVRRGSWRALRAAVAVLCGEGLLELRGNGRLARSSAPVPAGLEPLSRAVYAAIPAPTRLIALRGRPQVRGALAELANRVRGRGLWISWRRWLAGRLVLLATAWASIRLLATADEPSPYTQWISLAAVMLCVVGCFLPGRTVAGYRALWRLRRRSGGESLTQEGWPRYGGP